MNKDKLTAEIGHEPRQLSLLAEHAGELSQVPERERRPWHAAADLANGLENLCKRRYRAMGQSVPEGEDSHTRILDAFLDEPNLGGGLSDEEKHRLRKYLRFRHRFVHGYGHEVRWEIVDEPLRLLPETVATLCRIWSCWIEDTVRPR